MQDVDRVAHVQALPQPPRGGGVRVHDQPFGIMVRSQDPDGIDGHRRNERDLGQ